MKKVLYIFFVFIVGSLTCTSQEISVVSVPEQNPGTTRVYAELLGHGTNVLGLNSNVNVTIDLGQYQSIFKKYYIQDANNANIKFNSMVEAMNYMGERDWKFIQAYVISHGKQLVYHWLLYKDVTDKSQIMDGLNVKNVSDTIDQEEEEEDVNPEIVYSEIPVDPATGKPQKPQSVTIQIFKTNLKESNPAPKLYKTITENLTKSQVNDIINTWTAVSNEKASYQCKIMR